jgi:2-methylcitrate dehydratase PrpD
VIHPSAPVFAALLSVIGEDAIVSGSDVLGAFSVACELFIRIGISVNPKHYDSGWHITASLGGFGGAFAIAKLMGFNLKQTVNAAALAGLGTSGFRSAFGTMGKPYQVGLAASNSVLAAEMAQMGADGPANFLESNRGLMITTDRIDYSAFDDLGRRWEFMNNSFKPYPCGVVTHPVIDGGVEIHNLGIAPNEIEAIVGAVHPLVNELTAIQNPTEGLDGKFSATFLLALSICDGFVVPAQFNKECLARTDIRELMSKITFVNSKDMARDAVELKIRLKNGSERIVRIDHASGSVENPMNWKQVEEKYYRLTSAWGKSKQDEILSFLKGFDAAPRASTLVEYMKQLSYV